MVLRISNQREYERSGRGIGVGQIREYEEKVKLVNGN
jgi:hypothetical protein